MDEKTRTNMIEQQIRPWYVLDESVLALYQTIRRENFVANSALKDLAGVDTMLPAGYGQFMLEPKLEARMLQELAPQNDERVLHIGTGSGFFAALLSRLCHHVTTVEIIPELAETAKARLAPYSNVTVITADGARGIDNMQDINAIVLTGSTPLVAPEMLAALANGGRLLAVAGRPPAMTLSLHTKKHGNIITRRDILETNIPPLQNAPTPPAFEF